MSISEADVNAYLTRYAAALSNFDAAAGAALWSTPGMIADDTYSGVLTEHDDMRQGLEQSYPLYQQLGLDSVGHELHETKQLSEALVLVQVRWLFFGTEGELLTDANSYLLLRNEPEGLRAVVCVETDSAEKLRELAAARGVEL